MIPLFKIHRPLNIGSKIEEVFNTGFIGEGNYSDEFERRFGAYIGNSNTVTVNSCTSALTLALHMIGIDAESEVITTPMTCLATNQPIQYFGGKIVFADIDPRTGNIDPEDVKKKITTKTKAIIGVHWAGQPFQIREILEIANEKGIKVIEDAAHALGANYDNLMIGNHSDFVCFSFQAIKHLTTGDGGALAIKNKNQIARLKRLKWFGLDRNYKGTHRLEQDVTEYGYKFHMNNINSAIGIEQLKYISKLIKTHKENGKFYDSNINNKKITLLNRPQNIESSYWIYSLLVNDNREDFKNYMAKNNIASDIVHYRNDKYSLFKMFNKGDLKGVEEFSSKMINIPVGWWITESEKKFIVETINNY